MEGTRPCGEAAVYAAKAPFCSCRAPRGWPLSPSYGRVCGLMTSVMGWKPKAETASCGFGSRQPGRALARDALLGFAFASMAARRALESSSRRIRRSVPGRLSDRYKSPRAVRRSSGIADKSTVSMAATMICPIDPPGRSLGFSFPYLCSFVGALCFAFASIASRRTERVLICETSLSFAVRKSHWRRADCRYRL